MTTNFQLHEFINWPERQANMKQSDRDLAHKIIRESVTIENIMEAVELAKELQVIRNDFAKEFGNTPFLVLCWLRPLAWETHRGRNLTSQHISGKAVDFVPTRWQKVHRDWMLNRLKDWSGGMKVYKTFIHLDTGRRRRW